MILVVLENLVKRHDGVAVVDGASMEIRPGELTFVLGPSGSGKTTLARLIAGLDSLDDGEIYFDGRLVHDLEPHRRKVGFVFQDDALWPHLTVAENVGYPLRVRGVGGRETRARVVESLGLSRLDSVASRRPADLSPSQRQRAAMARALIDKPELLILDEPLGRLEGRSRDEFRDEIRQVVAEARVTTLVTSSDSREALALADRVAIMDLGKIVQSGIPAEVYNRPADAFVARFLGPINLIQGQVESTDAKGEVIVKTPLGRLIGQTDFGPLADGSAVTVSLRPEAVSFSVAAPHRSNRFVATVDRLVFQGATRQVHLRGGNDWPIVALTLQSQSQALREGQSVTVHAMPENVVVLPTRYTGPSPDLA